MKKLCAILLLAAMVLTLAACGGKNETPTAPTGNNAGGNTQPGGEEGVTAEFSWKDFNTKPTVKATTVECENDCSVTLESLKYEDNAVLLNFNLKNEADDSRRLSLESLAINNTMIPTTLAMWTEPDETATDYIYIEMDELRLYGIFEIAEIKANFEVTDGEWEKEDIVTLEVKTSLENPAVVKDAYYQAVTSKEAQEALGYSVVDNSKERISLGKDLYQESRVYMKTESEAFVLLEVVNEGDEIRSGSYYTTVVNTMDAVDGFDLRLYPGARAIFRLDLNWALPREKMEAFGMTEVYEIEYESYVFECDEDGVVDWDGDSADKEFTYKIPGASEVKPDMTGETVYEKDGLKIMVKPMVTDDWGYSYIYMIYEVDPKLELSIEKDWEKDVEVDGECEYSYLNAPGFIDGTTGLGFLELDNVVAESATIYLTIYGADSSNEGTPLELTLTF